MLRCRAGDFSVFIFMGREKARLALAPDTPSHSAHQPYSRIWSSRSQARAVWMPQSRTWPLVPFLIRGDALAKAFILPLLSTQCLRRRSLYIANCGACASRSQTAPPKVSPCSVHSASQRRS